jgi:hypothetical protein
VKGLDYSDLSRAVAAEWYVYRGFFVRTNIKFGKRPAGGYEGEIDVAAFDPKTKRLIHIETSTDADSWTERRRRFRKKFEDARKHYREVFDFDFDSIQHRAIVGFSRRTLKQIDFGADIEVTLVPDFIRELTQFLGRLNPMQSAVPEGYPLLRAMQFAIFYSSE